MYNNILMINYLQKLTNLVLYETLSCDTTVQHIPRPLLIHFKNSYH